MPWVHWLGSPGGQEKRWGWLRKMCLFRADWILHVPKQRAPSIPISAEVYCWSPFYTLSFLHQHLISEVKRSLLETKPNIFAFHPSGTGGDKIQCNLMPRCKRELQTIQFLSRDKKKSLAEPICFFPYLIIWFWRLVISKSKIFNIVNSVLQNIFLI